jgi:hypothetical protein
VKRVFQLLNQMVQDGEVPNYAIGGAIGAVFYIEPFATQDVNVFVMMETESTGLVTRIPGWDYLKERGYSEIRGEAIVVEDWPVQFIPVSDALEEEAYLNAPPLDFEGEPVRVVLAEHLVALRLKAGRLKDLSRVEMFLSQEAVDREILLDVVKRHGLERRWADFQTRGLQ